MEEETRDSRREMLKKVGKTAAFVIPTIFTFQASTMRVAASVPYPNGSGKISATAFFPDN